MKKTLTQCIHQTVSIGIVFIVSHVVPDHALHKEEYHQEHIHRQGQERDGRRFAVLDQRLLQSKHNHERGYTTQQERAVISNTMTNVVVKEHRKIDKVVDDVKSKFQYMDER